MARHEVAASEDTGAAKPRQESVGLRRTLRGLGSSAQQLRERSNSGSTSVRLDLAHMSIGSLRCAAIARGLRAAGTSTGSLESIDMSNNRLKSADIGALCACIVAHTNLGRVNFS